MMHPRTFVAQTTCAHINHFYRSVHRRPGVRRPGDRLLLHDLPAGARRGRQHGHRPGPPGGRYAGVPAVDLRSPQGRHDPRAAQRCKATRPSTTIGGRIPRRASRSISSTSPAAKAASASTSTRTATPARRCCCAKQDRLENWHVLQDLAGVRGGNGASRAAKPAAATPAAAQSQRQRPRQGQRPTARPTATSRVGTRIKYNDGSAWISGVVASLEPAVLKFDDNTVIETSYDVLKAGAAEGIIVRRLATEFLVVAIRTCMRRVGPCMRSRAIC